LKKTRDIDNVCKLTIKKVIKVNVNKAKYVGLLPQSKVLKSYERDI
jgi:uncharacterized protein (UPF0179 family)